MTKKIFSIITSFIIMLYLGGVYAWSIVVAELMNKYNFSASQGQFIFGLLIGILPLTMIFTGNF